MRIAETVLSFTGLAVVLPALPLLFLARRGRTEMWYAPAVNTVGSALLVAFWALRGIWAMAALMIVVAVMNGWLWWRWWKRRKRKRAVALLGAKSRALRDALVRAMRRERKPSRVLRPHPVPS